MASDDEHITWLHLSDHHAGQKGQAARPAIEQAFETSVRQAVEKLGVPDLLLFTGDIAFMGAEAEYAAADELLERINGWLGVEVPVFAVPGNHDLQRDKAKAWEYSVLRRYEEDLGFQTALWKGEVTLLDAPFANYRVWAERSVFEPARAAGRLAHISTRIPGDFSAVFTKGEMRLGIVGLNSSWVQYDGGDFEGKLQLPAEQFHSALPPAAQPLDWFKPLDASLLLTHHPRSWLSKRALEIYRRDIDPPGRFDLALYGHMHAAQSMVTSEAGTYPRAYFQAPSLFGLEHYGDTKKEDRSFGYAWGRVFRTGELRVWPKKVVDQAGAPAFVDDPGHKPVEDRLGGVRIRSARTPASPSAPSPTPRPTYVDPLDPDTRERYLEAIEAQHGTIKLLGFDVKTRVPLQLDGLHVPLDAVVDLRGRGREVFTSATVAEQTKLEMEGPRRHLALADAFAYARGLTPTPRSGLILLGDPGSGKTTHLKQVLLQVRRHGSGSMGLPDHLLPVFLPLHALRDCKGNLQAFITAQLRDIEGLDASFAEQLCKRGRLLLLFDGLDEVADADERARVAAWINTTLERMTSCFFIVSCRYAGYTREAELDPRFLELHLRPLDDAQMQAFVHNWYGCVEAQLGAGTEKAALEGRTKAEELLTTLTDSQLTAAARVYQMTRNPLLLTAICLVHYDHGRLPTARAKLYEQCVGVLLERWQQRRRVAVLDASGTPPPLSAEEALDVLSPTAAWMHGERGRTRASEDELVGPVTAALDELRRDELDARTLLRMIRDESGVLTGWSVDEYGFMHLGLQEYLTALRLRDDALKDPSVFRLLASHFQDSWWQEVILLMLAQRSPSVFEPFMKALLERGDSATLVGTQMMEFALNEAAKPSAKPFVAHVEAAMKGDEVDPEPYRAVVELLERYMPKEHAALRERMVEDDNAKVRAWREAFVVDPTTSEDDTQVRVVEGVELVLIPGGTFMMGTAKGDGQAYDNEHPQHEVPLASFYLAKTPVTNAQYERYLVANQKAEKTSFWGDRRYNQPQQPVVGISWHEARAYCDWAGLLLPTEAQWEYACRAGTDTRYWSGNNEADLARVGWYEENSDGRLHAVGELEANDLGLHDMHGNVWEWCGDNYASYETTSVRAGDGLRREPEGDGFRVVRGGSWFAVARIARSAVRFRYRPGRRFRDIGFRPVQGIS